MVNRFQDELVGKLAGNSTDNAVDTEGRVMEAYINQCTAEAQEGKGILLLCRIFYLRFQGLLM